MKPCEDWHRKIVRVLDNEAGDEDEREVAEHLHVCASCREFHDKFARIRGEFRSVAEPKVPTGIRQDLVKEIERVLQKLIVGPSPSEKPQGTKAEAGDVGSIVDAGRQSHGALQPGEARATSETPSEANVGMQTSCSSSTERTYRDSVLLRRPRWKWYLSAAAALIAGIAFLGGRLSAPRMLPMSVDIARQAAAETDGVNVPSDLVAWLDSARLFKRLGMEERMGRAFEYASELTPYDAVASISTTGQALAFTGDDEVFDNQNIHSILTEILGPHESAGSISGIMAQSFGDYYYENEMD